jgi:hypothetical protein
LQTQELELKTDFDGNFIDKPPATTQDILFAERKDLHQQLEFVNAQCKRVPAANESRLAEVKLERKNIALEYNEVAKRLNNLQQSRRRK